MVCQLLAKALRVSCAIMEIKPRVECLLDVLHKALYYMKRDCANIDDCVSVLQKKIEENKQKGEFDGSYEWGRARKFVTSHEKSQKSVLLSSKLIL